VETIVKLIGIIVLVLGLSLGGYALTMNVGVDVPARDFGYGVETPAMRVANVDLITQRQNYLIFSGILAVVGAILTGFASMQPNNRRAAAQQPAGELADRSTDRATEAPKPPDAVSICPKCRSMGSGDLTNCVKCGTQLNPAT
jgi:hypothetical protein